MENLSVAIVSAGSAVLGGVVAGIMSILANHLLNNREDRRRQEEIQRSTANERMNKLYAPLLAIMSGDPEDGFYLEPDAVGMVLSKIDQESMCASPKLLRLSWDLEALYRYEPQKINDGLAWNLYTTVTTEFGILKSMVGYGEILKEESWFNKNYSKLAKKISGYYRKIKREAFIIKTRLRNR